MDKVTSADMGCHLSVAEDDYSSYQAIGQNGLDRVSVPKTTISVHLTGLLLKER